MNPGGDGSQGQEHKRTLILRPLILATELGTTMGFVTVCTIGTGLIAGIWLDRFLDTRPLATLLCLLLSMLAGLLGMVDLAQSSARRVGIAGVRLQALWFAFSLRDLTHALSLVSLIVVATLGAVAGSLLLGLWLDRALSCRPIFTVLSVTLGTLSAMAAAAMVARSILRRPRRDV